MKIGDFLTIVVALFLFCIELFLFLSSFSLLYFAAVHLVVILVLVTVARWVYNRGEDPLLPLLVTIFTAGTGVFGLGAFLMTVLLRPLFSLRATAPSVWLDDLFAKAPVTDFDYILQRIRARWDDYRRLNEASSFHNLIEYGSLDEKQMVLDSLATHFDPQYASLLQEALKDRQNAVRIQAAAIVTKIDNDFASELKNIVQRHEEFPDDPQILLHLAEHAQAYAFSGVLDGLRQKEMIGFAIDAFQKSLKIAPNNKNFWISIGRLYLYSKEYESYINWYEEGRKRFSDLPSIVHTWQLECLYKLGRHNELYASLRGK